MSTSLVKEADLIVYTEGNVLEKNKDKQPSDKRAVSNNSTFLQAIGLMPKTDPKTIIGKITLLDGDMPLFELDKAKLALAVEANWKPDADKGIVRLYPYHLYGVVFEKHFAHQLTIIGDVKGLVFFLVEKN